MDLSALTEPCLAALSSHVTESMGRTKRCCAVVLDPSLQSVLYHATVSSSSGGAPASSTSSSGGGPRAPSPASLPLFMPAGATREYVLSSTEELDWRDDGPVVFILRPNPSSCKKVAFQMRALIRARARPDFKGVFIPRRSFRCEEVLKEEGVLSWFTQGLHAVTLGFVSLEQDVISMELDNFMKETRIDGDTSNYTFIARALLDFGMIKNIRSKGHTSKEVLELYLRMQREVAESQDYSGKGYRLGFAARDGEGQQAATDDNEEGSVGSSQYTNGGTGGEQEDAEGEGEDEDEDETYKLATKAGGPLDILGGFPRPSISVANTRRRRKSSSTGGAGLGFPQDIDTMILLDREIDMVSPLCTPLTYESLLDESFGGLKSGFLNIKSSVLRLDSQDYENDAETSHASDGTVQLSFRNDALFEEIRDVSVTAVMRILNEKAKELKETQDRMHRTRDVQDLQEFVQRLPELQQIKKKLTTHIALAQRVSAVAGDRKFRATWHAERAAINGDGRPLLERAQDSAARGDSLLKVLRLLCLDCILTGGFSSQKLDEVRQDLIHAYGFDVMFSLDNLERLGMLSQRPFHPQHRLSAPQPSTEQSSTSCIFPNWTLVKKTFRLVVEDDDQGGLVPTDCSYVFAGFAPLSCRLVQLDISPGGWASKLDTLRILGDSPTICEVKFPPAVGELQSRFKSAPSAGSENTQQSTGKKKVMLVCYLGGVSHAEIAALRFISAQPDCPFKIIVATTSVINGSTLLKACCHSGASDVADVNDLNPFG